MITVKEAFIKFRSRLELNDKEQADASRRQKEIRALLDKSFDVEDDFLTGSYARWTKTKPLKDVDIFCVLGEKERHYRSKPPEDLLKAVETVLAGKYGKDSVSRQRRSVTVQFGVKADEDENTNDQVMSFDVVPAFAKGENYEIPDTSTKSGWTLTNPNIHYDKAVEANKAYGGEWKGLVRMVKKANAFHGKPIKPSFLVEVMALDLLHPPFGGKYQREMKSFFATLADHIGQTWPDPAGLGPAVSDSMDAKAQAHAREVYTRLSNAAARAIQAETQGRVGDALRIWREEVFGKLFPLS